MSVPRRCRGNLRDALLGLGSGFALVGEGIPVGVGQDSGSFDLLFYQYRIRAFLGATLSAQTVRQSQLEIALRGLDREVREARDRASLALLVEVRANSDGVGPRARYLLPAAHGYSWSRWPPEDARPWLPPAEVIEELLAAAYRRSCADRSGD